MLGYFKLSGGGKARKSPPIKAQKKKREKSESDKFWSGKSWKSKRFNCGIFVPSLGLGQSRCHQGKGWLSPPAHGFYPDFYLQKLNFGMFCSTGRRRLCGSPLLLCHKKSQMEILLLTRLFITDNKLRNGIFLNDLDENQPSDPEEPQTCSDFLCRRPQAAPGWGIPELHLNSFGSKLLFFASVHGKTSLGEITTSKDF